MLWFDVYIVHLYVFDIIRYSVVFKTSSIKQKQKNFVSFFLSNFFLNFFLFEFKKSNVFPHSEKIDDIKLMVYFNY